MVNVVDFPAASGYGFGDQALRSSDSVTSGSFGDQTFSPGLTQPAGESGLSHFTATFKIGTTSATVQPGLHMSVSPDDGNGGRMSYLRFEDQADGVHVFFDDATDPGPARHGRKLQRHGHRHAKPNHRAHGDLRHRLQDRRR